MIDYYSIVSIFQSTIDLFWTSYEVKDSQKKWRLRFWPVLAVIGGIISLIALSSEILFNILEVLNTPIGAVGLTVFSHFPILGAVGLVILSALSVKKTIEIINSDNIIFIKKIEMLAIAVLKILFQLALLSLTIALLAFPPTGIAISATLLSICIVGMALSIYEHYQFKEQNFKNTIPEKPPSLMSPIPRPIDHGVTADHAPFEQNTEKNILSNSHPNMDKTL